MPIMVVNPPRTPNAKAHAPERAILCARSPRAKNITASPAKMQSAMSTPKLSRGTAASTARAAKKPRTALGRSFATIFQSASRL